ncbi:MAG: GNAT family N-acetyltransferase [Clostridia bacterium]|nr:GNAT family N-acetyltransferase [Clostridia bacterium]
MIREVTALPPLPDDSDAAVKIAAQVRAYGLTRPFLRVYAGEGGSVLSVLDGAATLFPGQDADEALLFIGMSPEIHALRSDAETAGRLAARLGVRTQTGVTMLYRGDPLLPESADTLSARDAYPLLRAVFGDALPPFDVWYADVSHRLRHGLCRIKGVSERGEAVSCAMTVAETPAAWLLGAVATRANCRGRGYASAVIRSLIADGHAAGKQVLISPKNEAARALYARLGFAECGTWGTVAW